jgi:tRNA pseudouridine38-40 synthase
VHARGQLVAFEAPRAIPPHGIAAFLRDALPGDVAVTAAWEEPGEVDPRRGNLGKHYRYRIRCTRHRDVHDARFTWQLARPLDPEAMQQAAWRLVGTHDFAAFRAARCHALSTERTLHAVDVRWFSDPYPGPDDPGRTDAVHSDRDLVQVDVSGNAFLYKMVRIIVGTLVEVGIGRWPVTRIDEILAQADRALAGPTAPPHGLTLVEVRWPGRSEGRHRESDQTDLLSS